MKLAEALLLRADLKKKLASLRERIGRNALLQEGETPKEKVEDLLAEACSALQEQQSLVRRINAANESAKLPDGRLLADVLALRDTLIAQHSLLISTISATNKDVDRYSQREIKWVPQIQVASLQKQADDLSRKIREVNVAVQATNWQIDI
ncbi:MULTISPECIES: DIP1984 family protein [Comamonas]|uniref:Septicolysin n=1 Tax=Comamonas testosteroni TaxID=285 RepID=A0A096H1A2_COMTE|nr:MULTISPECIES: DIP1984 family protein [Comamonas]KGH31205.1 septicolysin [Comamonas testosteroni]MPT10669.1 septicolysin [Comamonas sp.]